MTAKGFTALDLQGHFFLGSILASHGSACVAAARIIAAMLWIKSLHIIFVTSWFAGLFYLPRIFVNLAMVPPDSPAERERLLLMAHKLYRFMTLLMVPAIGFGLILWLYYGIGLGGGQGWMHAKLLIVAALLAYHHVCRRLLMAFERRQAQRTHIWYRWFNEIPVIGLVGVVLLVVFKPF